MPDQEKIQPSFTHYTKRVHWHHVEHQIFTSWLVWWSFCFEEKGLHFCGGLNTSASVDTTADEGYGCYCNYRCAGIN
ncbi:hypothetical protein CHUAL_003612 [Chamberlinius hualienensis]